MLGVLRGLCVRYVAQRDGCGLGRVDHRARGGGSGRRGGRGRYDWCRGRFRCGSWCDSDSGSR
jgi:hypothetical protein